MSLVVLLLLELLIDINNVIVDFNGMKCVLNVNGIFDIVRIIEFNVIMLESSIFVFVLFFFIC